jgi:adenylate cyclase
VVGNLGGTNRFDYTAIGDIVNLGARLEGANKEYRTRTIISDKTRKSARDAIIARELDLLVVAGKSEPIRVYELLAMNERGAGTPQLAEFLDHYDRGLKLYRERRWDEAVARFEAARRLRPDDFPSEMYIKRSMLYRNAPPPEDWSGVFVLERK